MLIAMFDPFSGTTYGIDTNILEDAISKDFYNKEEIDARVASVLKLCGQKETITDLPETGSIGDVWVIQDEGSEYAWIKAGRWEKLGPTINLNAYATKEFVNRLIGSLPVQYQDVVAYIAAVAATAGAALPATTFQTFLASNTSAIADAKKAGTDAAANLTEYKSANNQAVETVRQTANTAKSSIDTFEAAQRVFEATVENISELINPTGKIQTTDDNFSRRKTYYKLVDDEYIKLVLGEDYEAMSPISSYDGTVYEDSGILMTDVVNKINELVVAGNMLIAAHKQVSKTE